MKKKIFSQWNFAGHTPNECMGMKRAHHRNQTFGKVQNTVCNVQRVNKLSNTVFQATVSKTGVVPVTMVSLSFNSPNDIIFVFSHFL
jgi:hypothetical protein